MRVISVLTRLSVVLSGLTLVACSSGGGSELKQVSQQRVGDYVVSLLSESGQLKQGPNKYVMEFRRASDNQLLDVGEVKVNSQMPMPGMAPMIGGASVTPSGTPGRYNVESNFGMRGKWTFQALFRDGQRAMFQVNVQ
jgi:hypothetical protein